MAVKRKISKTEFDALSDEKKEFYIENSERRGEYILDMDADFNKDLTSALDRLKTEKTELEGKLEATTTELTTERGKKLDKDGAVSKTDHEAMKASYETKLATEIAKLTGVITKKDGFIRKTLVDAKATELATKISKVPSLMARVIKDRLSVDLDGDDPKTVVLDSDGKPSAFTLDDLQQEIVANKEFADIIIGSKANGGGNAPQVPGGGNAHNSPTPSLSDLPPEQLVAHMKATHRELT